MGLNVEQFRGIQFVRISSMSKDQQEQVWNSFDREKIIKIVKDESLLNDCILFTDFTTWQADQRMSGIAITPGKPEYPAAIGKLAFE
jgi:hypothetical protein